jgi:hypothetical protein
MVSAMRHVPNLNPDSGRTALAMQLMLIFDRDFGSRTTSIAIASHMKWRDLAMQAGERLSLDGSCMHSTIQAKPMIA